MFSSLPENYFLIAIFNFESEVLPDDSYLAILKLAHSLTLSKTT